MKYSETKQIKLMAASSRAAKEALAGAQPIEMEGGSDATIYEFNPNESFKEIVYRDDWKALRSVPYHEYRKAWDLIPREKKITDFPLHLDIETTNICNLRCPMCPRTIMLANESFSELGFMSREEYARIIDEGALNGLKSIKLNYLGEPLSHPDVVWQVQYAKDKGILDVMMNTNASLLTKQMGENLLNAGLDNLFVSFDAIDPEDFEIQRTGTSIGKVIDNLYRFTLSRNALRPACQIRVSMVMYKDPKWQAQFEAMQVMWSRHVDALGYGYYIDREIENFLYYKEVPGFYCAQPFQRMFLKYNGNVTICCVDDKDETVVGNWRNETLMDIWKGEKYSSIRQKHASGQYYDIEMCKKCYLPHSK
jgi:radical SAM protein with 4Fe4S-binding SPASM domain